MKRSREALNFKLRTACANDFDRCIFCECVCREFSLASKNKGEQQQQRFFAFSIPFFFPSQLAHSIVFPLHLVHTVLRSRSL